MRGTQRKPSISREGYSAFPDGSHKGKKHEKDIKAKGKEEKLTLGSAGGAAAVYGGLLPCGKGDFVSTDSGRRGFGKRYGGRKPGSVRDVDAECFPDARTQPDANQYADADQYSHTAAADGNSGADRSSRSYGYARAVRPLGRQRGGCIVD